MALIKCSECGKEISDKANTCVNCGCPINNDKVNIEIKKEKANDEKIISEIILDKERLIKIKNLLNTLYVVIGIIIYILMAMVDPYAFSRSSGGAFFSLCVFYFLPFGIIILLLNLIFKKTLSNTLVLTNKRIKGCVNTLLSIIEIDFPLNKINSILVTHFILNINGLSISSSIDKTKHLRFIKNANEFREKTIEEIEKNK